MKNVIIILIIALGLVQQSKSQLNKSQSSLGVQWINYTTSDGLIDNNVLAIAIDKQGYKWFGTSHGVSKFDGVKWTNYTTTNSGLINNFVNSIAIDLNNNIWFGTPGRGVSKFDGANWTSYTRANGLVCDTIFTINIDSQGDIWFGTWGGGVSKFDGTKWLNYYDIAKIKGQAIGYDNIRTIVIDKDGNKWFGTSFSGIIKFDGTNWTTYLANIGVYSSAIDAKGNKWFGTDEGASCFDGSNWITYTKSFVKTQLQSQTKPTYAYYSVPNKMPGNTYISGKGIAGGEVTAIFIDSIGNKWFGTDNDRKGTYAGGVSKFDGVDWVSFTNPIGMLNDRIHAIVIDAQGNKWFGTANGVSKFIESVSKKK